jgi:hypothetical protein
MSIIETLMILIKGDSSSATKAAKEAKTSTEQLQKTLKETSATSDKLSGSFVNLGRSVLGVVAAFASAHSIIEGLQEAYDYSLQLDRASQSLNVNAEALDTWGRAVKKNGGTVEGFQQSIRGLASNLNIRNQDALKLLPQLADIFKHAGTERSMRLGEKIGLDQATIMLLQHGRKVLEAIIKRQKELGVVTKKETDLAHDFNDKWSDLGFAFRIMWLSVAEEILPVFSKIAEAATKAAVFFQKHANAVVGALIGIGIAATLFSIPFIVANAAVIGLAAAIGVLIAGFAILYEDFVAFERGNSSFIGDMMKKYPFLAQVMKETFEGIGDTIKILTELFHDLGMAIDWTFEKASKFFGMAGKNKFLNLIGAAQLDTAAGDPKSLEGRRKIWEAVSAAEPEVNSPLMSQTSSSIFNNGDTNNRRSISFQTGDITINTQATDGFGIKEAFMNQLSEHFAQATGTFDDGVKI